MSLQNAFGDLALDTTLTDGSQRLVLLKTDGTTKVNPATSDLQTTANTKLDTLHTDSAAVLAKLTSDPSTATLQGSSNTKLDTLHTDLTGGSQVTALAANTTIGVKIPTDAAITLLTAASTSGSQVAWTGGASVCLVYGTWASAQVTLEFSLDGTTWAAVDTIGLVFVNTGADPYNIMAHVYSLPIGFVRGTIINATGSTSLTMKLARVLQ